MVIKNENIKVIFFDIGGVLLHIHPDRTINYLSDLTGISFEDVKSSFPEHDHEKYEMGLISDFDWYSSFRSALSNNQALTEEKFWQGWALLLGKESEVIDLMIDLKKYYKIWLLSNTNPKHIKDELDNKYVFPHLVDGAIYSFDVGLRKPDELIYQKSCEKANVLPNECVFIDDLKENIKGAKKVGLHGLHFTEMQNLQNDLKLLGLIK